MPHDKVEIPTMPHDKVEIPTMPHAKVKIPTMPHASRTSVDETTPAARTPPTHTVKTSPFTSVSIPERFDADLDPAFSFYRYLPGKARKDPVEYSSDCCLTTTANRIDSDTREG
jgi:hypothetical protein